jgi:hypothetical protein
MRPGNYALGSAQSRAAARSLLAARKTSEGDELRFEVRSIVDGARINFDGLAEAIRTARTRSDAEESSSVLPACEGNEERLTDSLSEIIRKARERAR